MVVLTHDAGAGTASPRPGKYSIANQLRFGVVSLVVLALLVMAGSLIYLSFQTQQRQLRTVQEERAKDAMAFLRHEGEHADVPTPDLILLDLNLPRKSGFEVLEDLKNSPDLKRIPVVILTSSSAEQDVLSTYSLHANCYITKPVDLEQFLNVIRLIEQFWLRIVTLPSPNNRI